MPGSPASGPDGDVLDAPQAGATAVRGGALRSGGYVLTILLSLVSAPLLIRHLGRDDYGVYVTITAVVTVVAGVSDFGVTSVGVREWATRADRARSALLSSLLGTRLAITLLGCVAAICFGLAAGYGSTRLTGMAVACLGVLVLACYEALAVPLQAELRQGWLALIELSRQAVQVALIVAFVAVGAGLVPMLASAVPAALAALLLTAVVSRRGIVRPAVHPREWWGLMRAVLPFATASAVSVLYLRTTLIITSLVAGSHQTGYFAVAFRVMEVAIGVPVLLMGALFPVLARSAATDGDRLRAAVARVFETALASGAFAAVCVAAVAPLAVEILTGKHESTSIDALAILGFGLGFSFIGAMSQYVLLALHAHREILAVNLVALMTNVVLTLLLAPRYGAEGAAISLASSEATVATISTLLLARVHHDLRLPSASTLLRIAVAAGLGVGAGLVGREVGSVVEALAACAVTGGVALLVGLLPSELWAYAPWKRQARSDGGLA